MHTRIHISRSLKSTSTPTFVYTRHKSRKMKASSSNLRYADNNDAIDDHIEVVKTVDDHDVVDVDSENANGVGDEKIVDNEKKGGRRSFVWDHFIFVKGGSLATHSFSQERCRKALARLCIKDNQPFSIVDNEGFQDYSWEMNPLFKMPSRWTVARDCLKIYKEEGGGGEKKLKGILKDQTVSLTTDTWSSVQNVNYMCLAAHWVDDDWVLRKKILNFCPIANHRGDTIGKMVYQCLQKWGIERVFTVTVDNASSNDGAIKFLGKMLKGPHAVLDCKYLHLRCCAHILNLVVRDGLEEQFKSISKIRNAVRYVRSSPARAASFRESVERVNIQCDKKPCLDVETRWNSTFLMLETAEKYADAFDRLKLIDYKYRSYFCGDDEDDFADNTRKRKRKEKVVGAPEEDDWEKARHFIEYLRGHGVNKTEVDIYLDGGLEKRDNSFDILNWWKVNSLKFPILSQVARHVLGMPISTVASESAFSTGGRVIDQFISSLTPKTAEALICVQDWIRSTPTDIGLQDMPVNVLEELQEKIEKIELDEFPTGQKSFESMDED
ncbi:zinc finger BED domain-containing protein RICESLEEPER 2-like protein [Tanacetum coccineum]